MTKVRKRRQKAIDLKDVLTAQRRVLENIDQCNDARMDRLEIKMDTMADEIFKTRKFEVGEFTVVDKFLFFLAGVLVIDSILLAALAFL